jgi:lysophospholipase L1-like esterase
MRLARLLVLALSFASAALHAAGPTWIVTWGDSITYGYFDDTAGVDCYDGFPTNDPPEQCGQSGRLRSRLDDAGLFTPIYDVELLNLGKGGERTGEALSRMDRPAWTCPCTEAASPCSVHSLKYWFCNGTLGAEDLLVLMEGTNDISQEYGAETIRTNLEQLVGKAEALGMNVVLSTLVPRHPDACKDSSNTKNQNVNAEIFDLGADEGLPVADPYGRLDVLANLFTGYYQTVDPMRCDTPAPDCSSQNCDGVGHPDGPGYDKMTFDGGALYAKTFESVVRGALPPRLTLSPPDPPLEPATPLHFAAALYDLEQTAEIVWDFGDGTVVPEVPDGSPVVEEHVYAASGAYAVEVTARHANGGERTAGLTVRVGGIFADGFESGATSEWSHVEP